MNCAALGDFLLALDKWKSSSSLACKQLKIEHPPCYISFLSYALQTERAVLPNKAWFSSHVPGPEWSSVEARRRDGNGQIISHSKYSLYLTAASGLQALCGGALESILLSSAKPCLQFGKGVIFAICSAIYYRLHFIITAIFTLDWWYLHVCVFSTGWWIHHAINISLFFTQGLMEIFGGKIVSELSEHLTSNLYVHKPWPCDCCQEPQAQTLHHKYGLVGP